jgi:hypothetical protein
MMKPLAFALSALILIFIFSTGSFAAKSLANLPQNCEYFHQRFGTFHFQRHPGSDGSCIVSADPFDITNFRYRGYLVSAEGLFMVFNSYSDQDDATATGARVFHFFPRKNMPNAESLNQESHLKFATPQIELILSQNQTKILRMTGATIKEDPKVQPGNKGGVEIFSSQTLYLDSGFALGHDITADADKYSTFYDINRKTCTLQNKELFIYSGDGDSSFRFSDAELKAFLKTKCPRLTVNF